MTHSYKITGMTCNGCVSSVTSALKKIDGIRDVNIDLSTGLASVSMEKHIDTEVMQEKLLEKGNYILTEIEDGMTDWDEASTEIPEDNSASDYKKLFPLFLVFSYLIGGVLLSQLIAGSWNAMKAMQYFMGGFFVVFSFFKLLDLKGFAYSFSTYDPIAGKWLRYGYIYPFIELALGAAYFTGINLVITNFITLIIVSIGTLGVAKTLLDKKRIQCACLGTVFNLPMTKVTLTENSVMIAMAVVMLIALT